jgi:hypothetical protein
MRPHNSCAPGRKESPRPASSRWRFIGVLLAILALAGCEHSSLPTPGKPVQRFVSIQNETPLLDKIQAANFALDTKTGQLCKSWDWKVPTSDLNQLPTCYSQYEFDLKER